MKIRPVAAICHMWIDGQTDRHDEAKSLFSHFCERASKETATLKHEVLLAEGCPFPSRNTTQHNTTQHNTHCSGTVQALSEGKNIHWGFARGVQMTRTEGKSSMSVQVAKIRSK